MADWERSDYRLNRVDYRDNLKAFLVRNQLPQVQQDKVLETWDSLAAAEVRAPNVALDTDEGAVHLNWQSRGHSANVEVTSDGKVEWILVGTTPYIEGFSAEPGTSLDRECVAMLGKCFPHVRY